MNTPSAATPGSPTRFTLGTWDVVCIIVLLGPAALFLAGAGDHVGLGAKLGEAAARLLGLGFFAAGIAHSVWHFRGRRPRGGRVTFRLCALAMLLGSFVWAAGKIQLKAVADAAAIEFVATINPLRTVLEDSDDPSTLSAQFEQVLEARRNSARSATPSEASSRLAGIDVAEEVMRPQLGLMEALIDLFGMKPLATASLSDPDARKRSAETADRLLAQIDAALAAPAMMATVLETRLLAHGALPSHIERTRAAFEAKGDPALMRVKLHANLRSTREFAESIRDLMQLLDQHAALWRVDESDTLILDDSIRGEVEQALNMAVHHWRQMFEEGS